MKTRHAFNSIDIAKVIASFFVLAAHADPFCSGIVDDVIVGMFSRLAVPFFYVVSAFLFFQKGEITRSSVKYYINRMFRLYVFWFIVEIPFMYLKYFAYSQDLLTDTLLFLQRIVLGNAYDGSYFIVASIECILLLYALSKFFSNTSLIVIGLVMYAITSCCESYYNLLPDSFQTIAYSINIIVGDISVSFIPAFVFFAFGKVLSENKERIQLISDFNAIFCLIFCLSVCYIESAYGLGSSSTSATRLIRMPLFRIPSTVFLFICIIKADISVKLPYKSMRQFSTILFFSQFIFINLFSLFSYHITEVLHLGNTAQFFVIAAMGFISYFIITRLSETNYFSWLKNSF